jgi:hypothetical protein
MAENIWTIGRIVDPGEQPLQPAGISREAAPPSVSVEIETGATLTSPEDAIQAPGRSDTLRAVRELGDPIAVEVSDSGAVVSIGLPTVTRVLDIGPAGDDFRAVRFTRDSALYWLRESDPRDRQLLDRLRQVETRADVAIFVDDDNARLLEVVPFGSQPAPPAEGIPPAETVLSAVSIVSRDLLDDFFAGLAHDICPVGQPTDGCFPIPYPDNYCWAVASEVGHRLNAHGFTSAKVWLLGDSAGSLAICTANHPSCRKAWGWHAAAIVRIGDGTDPEHLAVIDPSLSVRNVIAFPVWRELVSGLEEDPLFTPREIYQFLGFDNFVVEFPGDAAKDLKRMRVKLLERATGRHGPPPYGNCPTC